MLRGLYEALTEQEEGEVENGPLPEAWGVLYANPNPDDSRKQCINCMMWSRDDRCSIHEDSVEVTEDHVCGYHVYGEPMDERMDHPGMAAVTSELSGLTLIPGGTSCDICRLYFAEEGNKCLGAVGSDGNLLDVQPKGCCARWATSE